MKTTRTLSALLALALEAGAHAAPTANSHEATHTSGAGADITFTDNATYYTDWFLNLQAGTTTVNINEEAGTSPVTSSFARLQINVNSPLLPDGSAESLDGTVDLAAGSFSVGSSAASVVGVPVTLTGFHVTASGDYYLVTRQVVVTAAWSSSAKPSRSSSTCNSDGGGSKVRSTFDNKVADASFTGQVLEGSTNVIAGATATAAFVALETNTGFSSSR
jgi:hypothetical protein